MAENVLILAGGGGHTGYAYALAQRLEGKASLSFLAPEGDVLTYKRLHRFGNVDFLIKSRGPKTPTHKFVIRITKAFMSSLSKVSSRHGVVVSTGSNFCIPPAFAAWMRKTPVVNIESAVRFSKAAKAVRIMKPLSRLTVLQWEEQKKILEGLVVGPILPRPEVKPWNGGYILITGGTYGHKLLFDTMAESDLENIVLQTGSVNPYSYRERHPEWKVLTATDRFYELVAGAELVVTHFGSTVLEALAYGKPMVIALNPEWTRTVGKADAQCLAKKVNAVVVSDFKLKVLLDAIEEAKKRAPPIFPDGAEKLSQIVMKLAS